MVKEKKKQEKAEDFIGWKSPDGMIEVIGIAGKQGRITTFKIICTECSKDSELFPDGYFVNQKSDLVKGKKPCGCSKQPKWFDWQYLILARRAAKDRFTVHGFAEEFHGSHTKLNLECLRDGHKWAASIDNVINKEIGCPRCKVEQRKTPEHLALQKCIDICKEMDYGIVGFVDGYKNCYSRFEYICKMHGKQDVCYKCFVNKGSRCAGCWKDRQKELAIGFYGYYPERKDETDYLYILNFSNKFIKVGRSFDVKQRVKSLKYESKIKKISKLRIFTATHQEIYDFEQELHNELRERNFQHYVDWSTECFQNESLYVLNKMLDSCGLEEVKV